MRQDLVASRLLRERLYKAPGRQENKRREENHAERGSELVTAVGNLGSTLEAWGRGHASRLPLRGKEAGGYNPQIPFLTAWGQLPE